jgi:signal peptidase II
MQKVSHPQFKQRYTLIFLATALIITADQLTKIWIRSYPEGSVIIEIGFLRLIRIHNTGAAFGLFQGQSFAITIVVLVGVAILLLYALFAYRRFPFLDTVSNRIGLGLILGGTVGNLIDRLNPSLNGITDFMSISIWPAFNIADSAVTVGTILFAYSLIRSAQTGPH